MPVLATKLRAPTARHRLVSRSRLTSQVSAASLSRLILLSAPAGFGKTTLLAQALSSETAADADALADQRRVAWLSLDTGDNDARQFLTNLVAAVQTARPEVGTEALRQLETVPGVPSESVLVSLVNDLDALAGPTVLALDDYHLIETPAVHEAVGFLLDQLPPQTCIAMTTRVDPPLPLARLRARGELIELRANDLRFTGAEAEAFLNDVMGLTLAADHVAALEARTEGWVAGLQLAALSARGLVSVGATTSDMVGEFVQAFSGSHRFVLDYLVEEVLTNQPEAVRSFLLETSVLDQMTGGLCDALTGRSDGQQMLESLERANLFVVPLDDDRRWFRYHHLFADALRARLAAESPGRAAQLHAAAGEWYAARAQLEEAIGHSLAASDPERSADLVELAVARIRKNRENRTIRDWLHALPEEVVRARALLAAIFAWTRLSEGELAAAESWLDDAEAAVQAGPPKASPDAERQFPEAAREWVEEWRNLPGTIAVYRASLAQARGDTEGTLTHARRALELAGSDDHSARAGGAGFLALAQWARGEVTAAMDTFGQTVRSLHAAGFVADELGTTVVVAELWLARGRPDQARRAYERALVTAGRQSWGVLPVTADLHAALAEVLVEGGELRAAEEHLQAVRSMGVHASFVENEYRWYVAMSRLLRARGDLAGAVGLLDRAEPLFIPGFFPDVRPIPAMRARVHIAQSRLADAEQWARERHLRVGDPPSYLAEFDQLTLVRLIIAQHRLAPDEQRLTDAEAALEDVLGAARPLGREGSVIEALLVRALLRDARGQRDQALADLTAAIQQGVPTGYVRLFLDEGLPLEGLLRAIVGRPSPEAGLARGLLESAASEQRPATLGRPEEDQLSEREMDVLRLLASELTGPEIAAHLFVSVNTLRTHTKHIFTKLDVKTRRAAVLRGQELGLV
jgi:LuxR family transcriptional regulator, maltose regulon positive regulatory protein